MSRHLGLFYCVMPVIVQLATVWRLAYDHGVEGAKRILVRGPNFLGDHVLAFGFYRALRKHFIKSRLELCIPDALKGLDVSSFFDCVHPLSVAERAFPGGVYSVAKRFSGFDLAITLPASVSCSFFLQASGTPVRVGYAETLARVFLTDYLPWKGVTSGKHKSELYLDLARWLDLSVIEENPVPSHSGRKDIVVAPGASLPLREWAYFSELLIELAQRFPKDTIHVVGHEAKWHGRLARLALGNVTDRIGKTSLADLVTLCQSAKLVIANDSGVAHLASQLAQSPVVVIFGPGNPRYVKPLGKNVQLVRKDDLPCSPCESARCRGPYGYRACLTQLPVDAVLEKVAELI